MREHYPGWDITQSLESTVRQMVEAWATRVTS
jgi:CDP-paratose 2-epimerase